MLKKLLQFGLISIIILSLNSCVVIVPVKKDKGHHKGWYKNPHNPHNPNYNKNNKPNDKPNKNKPNNKPHKKHK